MATRTSAKPKILLDECMPPRQKYKSLNRYTDVKHLTGDFGIRGIPDDEVYKLAADEQRIMMTFNKRDFAHLIKKTKPSIIAVATGLPNSNVDKRVTSIIRSMKPGDRKGKLIIIG